MNKQRNRGPLFDSDTGNDAVWIAFAIWIAIVLSAAVSV